MAKIEIPEIINELTGLGWYLHEWCKCGGRLKYKYRHEEYKYVEVKWYPKDYQFRILYKEKTIVGMTPIGRLIEKVNQVLNDYFQETA